MTLRYAYAQSRGLKTSSERSSARLASTASPRPPTLSLSIPRRCDDAVASGRITRYSMTADYLRTSSRGCTSPTKSSPPDLAHTASPRSPNSPDHDFTTARPLRRTQPYNTTLIQPYAQFRHPTAPAERLAKAMARTASPAGPRLSLSQFLDGSTAQPRKNAFHHLEQRQATYVRNIDVPSPLRRSLGRHWRQQPARTFSFAIPPQRGVAAM